MTEEAIVRGGMCSNPFGSRTRLDRLDLLQFLEPNGSPEKVLFLATIQDAAHNYLFFALGRNGTTAEEFAAACQYFFYIRSYLPYTWEHARILRTTAINEQGKRVTTVIKLTDIQLRNMCFDVQFEHSGLSNALSLDRFLKLLKDERKAILKDNWDQISAYLDSIRYKETLQVAEGNQLPLRIWAPDDMETLVHPETPKQIADMLYYHKHLKEPMVKVTRTRTLKPKPEVTNEGVVNNSDSGIHSTNP